MYPRSLRTQSCSHHSCPLPEGDPWAQLHAYEGGNGIGAALTQQETGSGPLRQFGGSLHRVSKRTAMGWCPYAYIPLELSPLLVPQSNSFLRLPGTWPPYTYIPVLASGLSRGEGAVGASSRHLFVHSSLGFPEFSLCARPLSFLMSEFSGIVVSVTVKPMLQRTSWSVRRWKEFINHSQWQAWN